MFLKRQYIPEIYEELLDSLNSHLPDLISFICNLSNESDWSFVIKMQTVTEAILTNALIEITEEKQIKEIIERLPLADAKIGKIALARNLGLLTAEQHRFIRRMAELRNKLAHDIDETNFSFSEYYSRMTSEKYNEWKETLIWFSPGNDRHIWRDMVDDKTRPIIVLSIFVIAALLKAKVFEAQIPKKIDNIALRTYKDLCVDLENN